MRRSPRNPRHPPKTWQNYRDQRLIPFSQIGRKIYVNRTDLDAFLRQHRIGAQKRHYN
ncbi:helix-turn-helix domain-containing protein [Barnesiella sp. WM24]|uniref:helix-turn-helix domain-containing protein n=1 Tax=Barnesiella sp. WM24 TaxID=2558278 RepID=UPI00352E12A9